MYKLYGITDIGRVRARNEDGFVLNQHIVQEGDLSIDAHEPFWAVVADGMGGENAGDVASTLALEGFAYNHEEIYEAGELKDLIEQKIQKRLLRYMENHPESKGMGSTLAGIACTAQQMFVFHVGDSRVYRYRDGFLKQLTKDHSLVESLYESGQISYEEKRTHPQRNVLLRSLGQKNMEVDIRTLPFLPEESDLFLLCSDGLTEYVTEEEMEFILSSSKEIKEQARELVHLAKERGGQDNITVVLAKCENGKAGSDERE